MFPFEDRTAVVRSDEGSFHDVVSEYLGVVSIGVIGVEKLRSLYPVIVELTRAVEVFVYGHFG